MAGRPQRFQLNLTPQEREQLQQRIVASDTPARVRQRAQVLLLRADGKTYSDIEAAVGISTPTIAKILKKSFVYGPLKALDDLDRTGRSDAIGDGAKAWIVSLACQFPEDIPEAPRQPRWTVTSLSDYVRAYGPQAGYPELSTIQSSTVWSILNDPALKPCCLAYCLENRDEPDPSTKAQVLLLYRRMEFEPVKVEDALGTGYCALEPAGAAYTAVMQAVAATALAEPVPPGPRKRGDERFSVLTGIDMQTGYLLNYVRRDYTGEAFIEFLKQADRHYPQRYDIVLVLEKCWVYRTKEVLDFLGGCRKDRFHFICEHKNPYWLNLVECFLTKLVRQNFGEIRARSKQELMRAVSRKLVEFNREPVAFRWPGSAQEISKILCIDS